jgi:hypothetical protein
MKLHKKPFEKFLSLRHILKDKNRKSISTILKELIQLLILHRRIPGIYFSRHLYRKEKKNIKDYLPNKLLWSLADIFNDQQAANVLYNKLFFDLFYGQFGLSLPRVLMYNHKNVFVSGGRSFVINSAQDLQNVLEDLFTNKSSSGSLFIKKTYGSYGGDFTYKISSPLDPKITGELFLEVVKSGYLFQETIVQHPKLNELNPSSINSIRMDTFIDKSGQIEIISAYLRMSVKNLYVDNISSGGCCVGVDLQSGKLNKYGYTSFTKAEGDILTRHPLSGTIFEGFTIPHFTQAKELVIKAAGYCPGLRLIGWDVAIGQSGPILIEGNCGYDISLNDLTYGGFLTNPTFRKVLGEINYI